MIRFFDLSGVLAVILAGSSLLTVAFAQNSHPSVESAAEAARLAGEWQVSWQGRLGTEECVLKLQADKNKLTGTFRNSQGTSNVSGSLLGKQISLDIRLDGPKPYTVRFTGFIDGDKIQGTSQAMDVGSSGAYLGHGGEMVQPEHPWTAKRVGNEAVHPAATEQHPVQ